MTPAGEAGRLLLAAVADGGLFAEKLFDALPDVVFFVKDGAARYVLVNRTLAGRCGYRDKARLIGRNAAEVFPGALGESYLRQDLAVLASGAGMDDQLELHLYPNRAPGWCLTYKTALRDRRGAVVGLAGVSRDLKMPDENHPVYRRVSAAAAYIRQHYAQPIRLADVARVASLSASQIERYFQRIYELTPRQMIIKTRIDAAAAMLAGETSITGIAVACGYHDHSAFTRQFKEKVGATPSAYRALLQRR